MLNQNLLTRQLLTVSVSKIDRFKIRKKGLIKTGLIKIVDLSPTNEYNLTLPEIRLVNLWARVTLKEG